MFLHFVVKSTSVGIRALVCSYLLVVFVVLASLVFSIALARLALFTTLEDSFH